MTAITHVVLITWTDDTDSEYRERARAVARGFVGLIPGVTALQEGESVSPEGLEGGHNYGLVVTFENAEARDAYLTNPDHLEFVKLLDGHTDGVTVFDLDTV